MMKLSPISPIIIIIASGKWQACLLYATDIAQ